MTNSTVPLRAALYLRVSASRQAEHAVSIPDQKRQGEAYCESRGLQLVETFIELGATATKNSPALPSTRRRIRCWCARRNGRALGRGA
ncbi:recombinase family protein [Pelagibacterium halotolerans]|uniref:recombinase family protein n=1 Tax=Pelagibacterium halotolerans TaxID=531813 RepID=UPI00384DE0C4